MGRALHFRFMTTTYIHRLFLYDIAEIDEGNEGKGFAMDNMSNTGWEIVSITSPFPARVLVVYRRPTYFDQDAFDSDQRADGARIKRN
jgi:hypothetical protein